MSKLGGIISDTEVLTPTGWVEVASLRAKDAILVWCAETQCASFETPSHVSTRSYTGQVYTLESATFSQIVAKEQQLPYWTGSDNLVHCTAHTLRDKKKVRLPISGMYSNPLATDIEASILAGYVRRFQLFHTSPKAQIAQSYLLAWSAEALGELIDRICTDCEMGKGYVLLHNDHDHLSWLQVACHLSERRALVQPPIKGSRQHRLRIRNSVNASTQSLTIKSYKSTGLERMTTVAVDTGYMYIRHNGKISIAKGNK